MGSNPIGVIPRSRTEQHQAARLCKLGGYATLPRCDCCSVRLSSAACSVAFCGAVRADGCRAGHGQLEVPVANL